MIVIVIMTNSIIIIIIIISSSSSSIGSSSSWEAALDRKSWKGATWWIAQHDETTICFTCNSLSLVYVGPFALSTHNLLFSVMSGNVRGELPRDVYSHGLRQGA